MTAKERKIMDQVYSCVNRMTAFGPSNPYDFVGRTRAFNAMSKASGFLLRTLSSLKFQDWEEAQENIDEAKRLLGVTE